MLSKREVGAEEFLELVRKYKNADPAAGKDDPPGTHLIRDMVQVAYADGYADGKRDERLSHVTCDIDGCGKPASICIAGPDGPYNVCEDHNDRDLECPRGPAPLPDVMSALPQPISPPVAPAGVVFITLAEASRRSGQSPEALRRECQGKWREKGLARLVQDGSKLRWEVREDADPAIGRVVWPDAIPVDWMNHTDAQRREALKRKQVLREWDEWRAEALAGGDVAKADEFIHAFDLDVSPSTLYDWAASYRAGGLAGLVDRRRRKVARTDGELLFMGELRRLYLDPRKRGVSLCYAMTREKAEELGWAIPFGLRMAQKWLAREDRKVIAFHREGGKKYDGNRGPFLHRDYTQMDANAVWVSDGHTINVFVDAGGEKPVRPVLLSWMDVRSRKIVGHVVTGGTENSDTILAAFRAGALEFGVPESVYHDNGRAYDDQSLQGQTKRQRRRGDPTIVDLGTFERLQIKVRHSRPFNAKAKLNERFHGTLNERFSRRWETYCGSDPADKPHDLQAKLEAGKAPTLAEFQKAFADWLEADYHNRAHDGVDMEGKTPNEVFAANLHHKRTMAPEALDLELRRRKVCKVGRSGDVEVNGLHYGAPELDRLMGHEVRVAAGSTVGRVTIYDAGGKLICVAPVVERIPANATREQLREAIAEQRRDRRRVKEAGPARMRLVQDVGDSLARQAAKAGKNAPKAAPETIRPIRTKISAQLPEIVSAEAAANGNQSDQGDQGEMMLDFLQDMARGAKWREEQRRDAI